MTTRKDETEPSAAEVANRLEDVRALYKLMLSLREIRIDEAKPAVQRLK